MGKISYISPKARVKALMKTGLSESDAQNEVIKILNRLHNQGVLKKYPQLTKPTEEK